MSGIYIPGIEMPKDGERSLWFVIHSDGTVEYEDNKGFGWQAATAIPVPEHGDLIDRGYAIATACSGRIRALPTTEDGEDWIRVEEVRESIKAAPTIIPAEEGEE